MVNVLLFIAGWAFIILSVFGLLVFIIYLFYIIMSAGKGIGPLPWWVFWRH